MSEANSDTMNDMPRGLSILPSRSPRKKRGTNVMIIISVAFHIDDLTSVEALYTMLNGGSLLSGGRTIFFLSSLYMFSTSIIASSTSEPIAIAMPPRLIVLIV